MMDEVRDSLPKKGIGNEQIVRYQNLHSSKCFFLFHYSQDFKIYLMNSVWCHDFPKSGPSFVDLNWSFPYHEQVSALLRIPASYLTSGP